MTTSPSASIPNLKDLRKKAIALMNEKPSKQKKAFANATAASVQPDWLVQQNRNLACFGDCTGNLYIGVFFDGTGNNKDEDYGKDGNPKDFLERKHTNVVRLHNAFPDEDLDSRENKPESDYNQFRRIYVPGVGTKFPEIGENGEKFLESELGSGAATGGEARILWAMIQVLNSINMFYRGSAEQLIKNREAFDEINKMAYGEKYKKGFLERISDVDEAYNMIFTDDVKRKTTFEGWIKDRLVIPEGDPELKNIYIYTFGFSRGAAEARTFTNWMMELTTWEGIEENRKLKDISIRFPFLGIFDTVASVGAASMYSFSEGHWGWALETQKINKYIGKCVHMVAAHEVRACFPLDSVRRDTVQFEYQFINGTEYPVDYLCFKEYPGNCEEIVYPGAHSDVGGGYAFNALGKVDVDISSRSKNGSLASGDLQISRIPGFDMYLRAMEANVPFYTFAELKAQKRADIAQDLLPDIKTIDAMDKYLLQTNIGALPVELQLKWHTSLYLHWRWKQGKPLPLKADTEPKTEFERLEHTADCGVSQKEIEEQKLKIRNLEAQYRLSNPRNVKTLTSPGGWSPDGGSKAIKEKLDQAKLDLEMLEGNYNPNKDAASKQLKNLIRTQQELMAVIAGYCNEIDKRIKAGNMNNANNLRPLDNPRDIIHKIKTVLLKVAMFFISPGGKVKYATKVYKISQDYIRKQREDTNNNFAENTAIAARALEKVKEWRNALKFNNAPEIHDDEAPEREAMYLFDALAYGEKIYKDAPTCSATCNMLFSEHVHDSMAGFPVPEFTLNGYGIGKFRRLYFGDQGDASTRLEVIRRNEVLLGKQRES